MENNTSYIGETKQIHPKRQNQHINDYKREHKKRKIEIEQREKTLATLKTRSKKEECEKLKQYYNEIDESKIFPSAMCKHAILNDHRFDSSSFFRRRYVHSLDLACFRSRSQIFSVHCNCF